MQDIWCDEVPVDMLQILLGIGVGCYHHRVCHTISAPESVSASWITPLLYDTDIEADLVAGRSESTTQTNLRGNGPPSAEISVKVE